MVAEHVCLISMLLIVQSSLTYDLIETASTLPKGYITVFVKEEISEGYLHMGQMIVGESSRVIVE
jgi:hypothetical protein